MVGMTEVVLPSIRHTGTWFTIRLLTKAGFKETHVNAKREDNTVYHGHIEKPTQIEPAVKLAKHMPLVIPMRHPYMVEESWRRRSSNGFCTTDKLIECFHILADKFLHLNPIIIPIDSDKRETQLAKLASVVGKPLTTDWQPVHSKHQTYKMDVDKIEPSSQMQDLVDEMFSFFAEYYR